MLTVLMYYFMIGSILGLFYWWLEKDNTKRWTDYRFNSDKHSYDFSKEELEDVYPYVCFFAYLLLWPLGLYALIKRIVTGKPKWERTNER